MDTDELIVIIGAGIGGLSAAIRLAAAGKSVTIYEKNAQVGGKMNEIRFGGCRFDVGPSVITMRHVFEELFESAGRRLEDYLTLLPVEPLTRYFYPDGTVLDATRDLAHMAEQIAQLDERDVEGYMAFLAYAARIHRITGPVYIYNDPPNIGRFLRVPIYEWPRVDPLRSMYGAISRFVRSPHLRQLLGRFGTYVGANPYQAPATLNVISHVELTGGVWYPQGGIYQIAEALKTLAEELGVKVHTGCAIKQILVVDGRAVGVELEDGQIQPAQVVLANLDVAHVAQHLLPDGSLPRAVKRTLLKRQPSVSGYVMLLKVAGSTPQLAQHNILFSSDYKQEFDDIFKRAVPPTEPTVYIYISSKVDADHAPAGYENWFVLINAPPLDEGSDWVGAAYQDVVFETMRRFGLDVADQVAEMQILTPLDIADMTAAYRGALYGASSNNPLAAFRRPHNRSRHVKGLYFAGGTSHPGGGVPMVTLSGKVAARMILEDLA
ncbi:MAG: phytoene desaturase [Chloroflexi bacterium]|nr:phytoene desaturase [Chloroflexota bacterium]